MSYIGNGTMSRDSEEQQDPECLEEVIPAEEVVTIVVDDDADDDDGVEDHSTVGSPEVVDTVEEPGMEQSVTEEEHESEPDPATWAQEAEVPP